VEESITIGFSGSLREGERSRSRKRENDLGESAGAEGSPADPENTKTTG